MQAQIHACIAIRENRQWLLHEPQFSEDTLQINTKRAETGLHAFGEMYLAVLELQLCVCLSEVVSGIYNECISPKCVNFVTKTMRYVTFVHLRYCTMTWVSFAVCHLLFSYDTENFQILFMFYLVYQ